MVFPTDNDLIISVEIELKKNFYRLKEWLVENVPYIELNPTFFDQITGFKTLGIWLPNVKNSSES